MSRIFAWLIKWVIYGGKVPAVCMWCEYSTAAPICEFGLCCSCCNKHCKCLNRLIGNMREADKPRQLSAPRMEIVRR